MKKIVLKFGLISGVIIAALTFATVPFHDSIGFDYGHYVGYSKMLVAFLLVFFGVRAYRENVSDGHITFWRGLGVGLLITLVSIICYVIAWEIVFYNFFPDFADKYSAYLVEKQRNSGASAEQIASTLEQMKTMKAILDNPFWFAIIGFIEPLPVALPVSFISAIVLRKKPRAQIVEQQPAIV
jgi:hypothetical protein